jgi:glycosyltransferase involved in cell wall biosynthesis
MIPARRLSHLLVLLPSTAMGGTERHSVELAARLAGRAGLRVTLAGEPMLRAGLQAALPPGLPAPALIGANTGWDGLDGLERQAAEATRVIAETQPDIAVVPLPWPDAGLGLLRALARAGLPRLAILHLLPEGALPGGLDPAALRAAEPGAAAWAAVSTPAARRGEGLLGLAPGFIRVVPNAAPPLPATRPDRAGSRRRLGLAEGERVLLFLGRLDRAKGADLLPGIAEATGLSLLVAGDGALRKSLAAAAAAPGSRLRLLGRVADPGPLYAAADALLLPSRMEGAPLVFMEAAAHGVPVVGSAAALEALGDEAPRMARVAAEEGALASEVQALFADPAGTAARVAAARALARHLSWPRATETWLGLLRAAVLRAGSDPTGSDRA